MTTSPFWARLNAKADPAAKENNFVGAVCSYQIQIYLPKCVSQSMQLVMYNSNNLLGESYVM